MRKHSELLELDGYLIPQHQDIPGHFVQSPHNLALGLMEKYPSGYYEDYLPEENYLERFGDFVERSKIEQKNILLSSEVFSLVRPELINYILSNAFKMRIVIGHRRYYEWLKSFHNQLYKMEWTKEGFISWLRNNYEENKSRSSLALYESYKEVFNNVIVMNFHDEKQPLLLDFYCNAIGGLKHMCGHLLIQKNGLHKNKSVVLEIKEIIQLARTKNMLEKNINEKEALIEITSFMQNELKIDMSDLPSECIDDAILEDILQYTLHQEKTLFPAWFEEIGGETKLREDFEGFKKTSSCGIHTEAILEDIRWIELLRGMNERLA